MSIDLNCDLGESFGIYTIQEDDTLLDYVSSVNIACGFHAGDSRVMHDMVSKAIKKEWQLGPIQAYPIYKGLAGGK